MTDADSIAAYVTGLRASKATIAKKRQVAVYLSEWLARRFKHLSEAEAVDLVQFLGHLRSEGTVSSALIAPTVIRELFSFLYVDRPISENPTSDPSYREASQIRGSQVNRRDERDRYFSADDLNHIFAAGEKLAEGQSAEAQQLTFKRLAIAELIYSSGLLPSEIAKLKLDQFATAQNGYLNIGDGNATRMVPVTPTGHKAVQRWIHGSMQQRCLVGGDFVFEEGDLPARRAGTYLARSVSRLGHAVNERGSEKLSASKLRDSFAVELLKAGANRELLSYVLGLQYASSLRRYVTLRGQNEGES